MKIYIRSAGTHPEQGYDWWRLSDQPSDSRLFRESPGFAEGFDLSWFDDDQLSLILRDHGQGLNLLVTGLPTENRIDFAGRMLRNDLAFSATDSSEERQLRNLTAAFIDVTSSKELALTIDACIRPSSSKNESGFQVDTQSLYNTLDEVINSMSQIVNSGESPIKNDKFQVAVDSIERRQEVITWLTSEAPLPTQLEGRKVLVLVASYPGLPGLLSENIDYQNELRSRCKEICCQLTNVVNWKDWRIIEPVPLSTDLINAIETKMKKSFMNLMSFIPNLGQNSK